MGIPKESPRKNCGRSHLDATRRQALNQLRCLPIGGRQPEALVRGLRYPVGLLPRTSVHRPGQITSARFVPAFA